MPRPLLALALAALLAGCSVVPMPGVSAQRGQSAKDQKWDSIECQEYAGERVSYNPAESPFANVLAKLFFWGTAGAAIGGFATGLPTSVSSQASEGLIAGAGAGGIAGGVHSLSGQSKFERIWVACMEARGYQVAPKATLGPPDAAAYP